VHFTKFSKLGPRSIANILTSNNQL